MYHIKQRSIIFIYKNYNFFSCLLRALGNSVVPLVFLAVSTVLNISLDLLFIAVFPWGIKGAAVATVLAQYVSAIGIVGDMVDHNKNCVPYAIIWAAANLVACLISVPYWKMIGML